MLLTILLLTLAVGAAACSPTTDLEEPGVNTPAEQRLLAAASTGDVEGVRTALRDGADLETRGENGMTALIIAAKANHVEAARTLIEAGADVNAQDDIQDSAYLYAGARGHDEILRLTLESGADLSSTNRFGGTALIPASERGLLSTVQILLDAGVDPNHVNNLDWTALHEAIVLGDGSDAYVEVVRALLAGGADPAIADGEGASPRELAAGRGYDAIVAVLDTAL
ncbi:ankyrin repeat domain-containing protein [Microbacterium murale]|uniref:Ankyrin repeat protein n=1 Tax=Microbacterium murale TaxID=1081040 RepID=A0ABU0P6K8_9MICO|nr:ankyrin repeat domain-containing protein [Microbacterium murale]MDQ0642959.1 ankyrin repeat protein [Microbacterium murale]